MHLDVSERHTSSAERFYAPPHVIRSFELWAAWSVHHDWHSAISMRVPRREAPYINCLSDNVDVVEEWLEGFVECMVGKDHMPVGNACPTCKHFFLS